MPKAPLATIDGKSIVEIGCRRDVGVGVMLPTLAYQYLFEVKLAEHCVAIFDLVSYFSDVPSLTGIDDTTPLR